MTPPKDVHAEAPARGRLRLRSVGLSGIRKPLNVQRGGRTTTLAVTFDVGVDLPSGRKGSDLSRNAEILAEEVKTVVEKVPNVHGATVELVWEPPWTPERMSDFAKRQFGYA